MARDSMPAMLPETPTPRELARYLIGPETAEDSPGHTAQLATLATFERVYRDLSRWVGSGGCHALFTRALAEARIVHPLLGGVQLQARSQPYLQGTAEIVDTHGGPATAEALEAMLVAMIELLNRLIGADMAATLILKSLPQSTRDAGFPNEKRAEA